jgi:hypothetical protein
MIYLEEAIKKFEELPLEVILELNHPRVISKIQKMEKIYGISLISLVVFIAIDELAFEDIEKFLQTENDITPEKAVTIGKELRSQVFEPLINRLNFTEENPDKPYFPIAREKEEIIKILSSCLISEIENYPPLVKAVNQRIFFVLSQDSSFKIEMEKAMYNNQEIVSDKSFVLDNKKSLSTVSNWLKELVNSLGTNFFDILTLSRFMISSQNVRRLEEKEKDLLFRILKTYYHIKFFPESMPDDDGTGWEILPVDKIEGMERKTIGTPQTPEEKEIEQLKKTEEGYGEDALERLVLEEEIEKKKKKEDLMIMAKKYPEGSIERMAIEEEIKRI